MFKDRMKEKFMGNHEMNKTQRQHIKQEQDKIKQMIESQRKSTFDEKNQKYLQAKLQKEQAKQKKEAEKLRVINSGQDKINLMVQEAKRVDAETKALEAQE